MIYTFKYRLPGARLSCGSWSRRSLASPCGSGFLIAPFLPGKPRLFIPLELVCYPDTFRKAFEENGEGSMALMPETSVTSEQHRDEILAMIHAEKSGELTKGVAARVLTGEMPRDFDIDVMFESLCRRYPSAFVYLFSTPETGTWIGASPELLLENKENMLRTMALAGTRPVSTPGVWDSKNMQEHDVVTDFITRRFRESGVEPEISKMDTAPAGPVEHLLTEITGKACKDTDVSSLLDAMSPTPALCGQPRDKALRIIADHESFSRDFYGGYCGPWYADDDFNMFVTIRCAHISPSRYALYAGGGIMPDSIPDDEWKETENKIKTLLPDMV